MKKKFFKCFFAALLVFSLFGAVMSTTGASAANDTAICAGGFAGYIGSPARSFSRAVGAKSNKINYSSLKLYVGGMPFGVKFITDGVLIVGFCDVKSNNSVSNPSIDAGLKMGDIILKIDGKAVNAASELLDTVEKSGGRTLLLICSRDGKEYSTRLTPCYSSEENCYKSGLYVRDSGAGIGTVTYIMPSSLEFAGLGHGICDAGTGELIPMQRGSVVNVTINGVVKGLAGSPGEVKGYFSSGKIGSLLGNSECGVYGVLAELPENTAKTELPIGTRNELKEGKAYIYCTLDESGPQQYEIEISGIKRDATSNKCFTVKVTDASLIDKTGGIIQGMSGSPIIQDGKLVGAVTHVLINDPTTGYGIFIENMLNAAQMPMQKAS